MSTYVLDGGTVNTLRTILRGYLLKRYSPEIAKEICSEIENLFEDYIRNHSNVTERKE